MQQKTLQYYQALPYTRRYELIAEAEEGSYWIVYIEELPGCKTDGSSIVDAMANLEEVFDEYIEAKLEWGTPIPEPAKTPVKVTTVTIEKQSEYLIVEPIVGSIDTHENFIATDKGVVLTKSTETADEGKVVKPAVPALA